MEITIEKKYECEDSEYKTIQILQADYEKLEARAIGGSTSTGWKGYNSSAPFDYQDWGKKSKYFICFKIPSEQSERFYNKKCLHFKKEDFHQIFREEKK